MTNVVVRRLVPDVSELGWDVMGGAYRGVVSAFVVWVLLLGTGGFHGGGSRFCACGHLFVFVLGHMSLFGWSLLLSGDSCDRCTVTGSLLWVSS